MGTAKEAANQNRRPIMRTIPISELHNLESGEIIPAFEGTVTKVYEQKHGPGEFGDWYLQNMIVEDGDSKVQVTWSGEDAMTSEMEGNQYRFESSPTTKFGLQGCKWDVRTSKGKRYEGIKLTGSCKIKRLDGNPFGSETREFEHGGERQTGEANPAARRDDPPTQNKGGDATCPVTTEFSRESNAAPTVQSAGAAQDEGVMIAKRHIMQAANLHRLCIDAVNAVTGPHVKSLGDGSLLTPEFFQACVASLFIEASRSGLVSKMQEKPL